MRIYLIGCLLLNSILAVVAGDDPEKAMAREWAGYKAKILCSCIFVSGRDEASATMQDLAPLTSIPAKVDRKEKSVSILLKGELLQKAIYREGLGCTLVNGLTEADIRAQYPQPEPVTDTSQKPWPMGDDVAQDLPEGVDRTALEHAIDLAFQETDPSRPQNTRAVVVVYNGALVAERYAPGFNQDTALMGWSMTKSLMNALTGILVGQGKLKTEQLAPVGAWRKEGDKRGAITLNHLLQMSSGLAFQEKYGVGTDVSNLLLSCADPAVFAADKSLEHEPGSHWSYSSGTSNIVAGILRQAHGGSVDEYLAFPRKALFNKIGMRSAVIEPAPSGIFVGSSYSYATARDWARFGLLYLNDGVWQGERILPEGWVTYSATPAPSAPKGCYGAHFWLNHGTVGNPEDRPQPQLPPDLFMANGYEGQRIAIIPSRKVVLVRLGLSPPNSHWQVGPLLKAVLAVLPDGATVKP